MEHANYETMAENEIVARAKADDPEALEYLLNRYKGLVRLRARAYYLVGADREDLIQEGMIGLYRAICDFDSTREVSFQTFADVCITRHLITVIKTATRQKHRPLNTYVPLNNASFDDDEDALLESTISDETTQNPEDIVIDRENLESAEQLIQTTLSKFENRVLREYLEGKSYQEIAAELDRTAKSIDNALQRTKAKLEKKFSK